MQGLVQGRGGYHNATQRNARESFIQRSSVSLPGWKEKRRCPSDGMSKNQSHERLFILHWQPNQGTVVNSQVLNEISQCVESLNGVKEGRCKASLTFYRPNLRDQSVTIDFPRDFLGISMLEQPNKYYFIIRGQKIVLEADSSILTIMEKLQSYKSKVALHFEGVLYKLGDFQIRVIKVVPNQAESLRGIMIESFALPLSCASTVDRHCLPLSTAVCRCPLLSATIRPLFSATSPPFCSLAHLLPIPTPKKFGGKYCSW
ncbi:Mediator of RNA polymerase II transcription subunit 20a, partial [Mucuna pruriens]